MKIMIEVEKDKDSRNFEHLAQNFPPKNNYPPFFLRERAFKKRKTK